ncbi:hypothetical protein HBI08_241650 [Parastagonospora nodorum]|nr:hypothetical protein HBI84_249690 [Parastagonospora nodorum]KAH6380412.1 hypothetical protein HBI08_241650 [Parastagonospora nodorum]KAH6514423.1 hypothetical protein HBI07_252300 [Parastagonospora nodorum]
MLFRWRMASVTRTWCGGIRRTRSSAARPTTSCRRSGRLRCPSCQAGDSDPETVIATAFRSNAERQILEKVSAPCPASPPTTVRHTLESSTYMASFVARVPLSQMDVGIESDGGDDADESAIEEDGSNKAAWEDSSDEEESYLASFEGNGMFHRVDSKASYRSLLTAALHESDSARQLQNGSSPATSAIRRSSTTSQMDPPLASRSKGGLDDATSLELETHHPDYLQQLSTSHVAMDDTPLDVTE